MIDTKTNTIPLTEAEAWVAKWQKDNPTHSKAFLIPIQDVVSVLIEMNVLVQQKSGEYLLSQSAVPGAGMRAYNAIDTSMKSGNPEKLLIVGTQEEVQRDGTKVYRDIINGQVDALTSASGSGIYDFTRPCPSLCDDKSPLVK